MKNIVPLWAVVILLALPGPLWSAEIQTPKEQVKASTVKTPSTVKSESTVKTPSAVKNESAVKSIALFPSGDELGEGWAQKKNVTLAWNAKEKAVAVAIDCAEFAFGWFQRPIPNMDYAPYRGIAGRFRVPSGKSGGDIAAILIVSDSGKSGYYTTTLGKCAESRGDWVGFYLPFRDFRPSRDATKSGISGAMLRGGGKLEISINAKSGDTTIEFADVRILPADKEAALARQYNRERLARSFKPESELSAASHPRLLLHGERLARIRAKATAGGIQQAGYEQLIKLADQAMKRIDADAPFGKAFQYRKLEGFNDHVNRGRFEGTLNPLVIPLETLAAAAVITGEEKYGRHAARALVNMSRTLDVDCPEINQGFYYTRTFYVRALAFGYDWLYQYMTPEERRDVRIALLGFVRDIYNQSWTAGWGSHPLQRVWNWDPGLVSCAGLGVLAIQGETTLDEVAMLVQFRRHLRDYLTFGVDFDGCCHEGPSYISYGIGSGVQFAECLRDKGYGDMFLDTNWRIIAPWLVSELLPGRPNWNNLSDCNYGAVAGCPIYAYTCGRLAALAKTEPVKDGERLPVKATTRKGLDYIQHFSERPGDKELSYGAMAELMGWCWNRSVDAQNPAAWSDASTLAFVLFYEECPTATDPGKYLPDSLFFRGRGLVVSRTGGYGRDGIHLAVEAGPHASGHDQSDKGSFTFSAYGSELAIDSGYGNDGEKEKSGSSFAHNIVLIDGKGQPMSWHNCSNGEITGYMHNDLLDWIRADAKDAWNFNFARWNEEPTGMDVERADRHYLFVRGQESVLPYLITFDDFRKKDGLEHEYTWQWHISPEFQFKLENDRWTASQDRQSRKVLTTAPGKVLGSAVLTLTAGKAGKYNIVGLTRAAGTDRGKSDSFFLGVNDGPKFCWDLNPTASFGWSPVRDRESPDGTMTLELAAGEKVKCTLQAREPDAQLAMLGLVPAGSIPMKTNAMPTGQEFAAATDAVQNPKTPFLLAESVTSTTETTMTVFPVLTAGGKTETVWYETSKQGSHMKMTHSVKSVEPRFLMVWVPRPDQSKPLPQVRPLKRTNRVGVEVQWPDGWTDRLVFHNGPDGLVPDFQRLRNGTAVGHVTP